MGLQPNIDWNRGIEILHAWHNKVDIFSLLSNSVKIWPPKNHYVDEVHRKKTFCFGTQVERRDKFQYNFLPLASSGRVTTLFPLFRADVILISRILFEFHVLCLTWAAALPTGSQSKLSNAPVPASLEDVDRQNLAACNVYFVLLRLFEFDEGRRVRNNFTQQPPHKHCFDTRHSPNGDGHGRCKSTPSATELGIDVPAFEAVVEM